MRKKTFWVHLKNILIHLLRGRIIKLALKKILGSAAMGGFQAWLVKYIVTELYDELGEPILKAGVNYVGYRYDKYKGKVHITRLEKARDENDENNYNRTIDTILN